MAEKEDTSNGKELDASPMCLNQPHLIANQLGDPVHILDQFRGCPAFLIGGGPSFLGCDREKLMLPGCLTMAMNNAVKSIRPDLWVSVDDPSHFMRSIWFDPKIMKFAPFDHASKPIFDSDAWAFTDKIAGDCPNSYFYRRNDRFHHESFLTEEGISWGNSRKFGGGRSVMLPALRILHYLGVRQVFLLGVDFHMDAQHMYHFPQRRHRAIMDCNRRTYETLEERFQLLLPFFERAGFDVFNCNPTSSLTAFPFLDFEEAVARCRAHLPDDLAAERTEGLYDQSKGRKRIPPPRPPQPLPAPPPILSPPRITVQKEVQENAATTDCAPTKSVVVGADIKSEWMLGWWYENYSKHNDIPVTFVDFGMSEEWRNWCATHGRLLPLPRRYPRMPHGWFYKPILFLLSDADLTLAIDTDCEIRGSVDPIFELSGSVPAAAKDPCVFRKYRKLFRKEHFFNTGVICAKKDDPLILRWGQLTLEKHGDFRSDQELFNYVLYESPNAEIIQLPERFNRLQFHEDTAEDVILHWTGDQGKEHIRKQIECAT